MDPITTQMNARQSSHLQQQHHAYEDHNTNDIEDEEMFQRKYQEQQQQEEYYQQQMEMQQRQIFEQQQMLEQMRNAMHQQQNQQLSNNASKTNVREPPSSVKKGHNQKNSLSGQKDKMVIGLNPEQSQERRLEIIETSLNRVCNQHDALMPLLKLIEIVPQLQRSEQQVKNLSKKYIEIEKKIKDIDGVEKKDQQQQHIFSNIERNFKNTHNQIQQLRKDIIHIEGELQTIQQVPELKMKENTIDLYRQVDTKLDKNMKEVKYLLADFKNQLQLENKRGQSSNRNHQQDQDEEQSNGADFYNADQQNKKHHPPPDQHHQQQLSNSKLLEQLNEQLQQQEKQFQSQILSQQRQLSHLQQHNTSNNSSIQQSKQVEIDVMNIYREIGMLRSEMELLFNQQRQELIQEQVNKTHPKTEQQKQLLVFGLEQNMFLQEIESFDKLNQNRIQQELDSLLGKIHAITQDMIQQSQHGLSQSYSQSDHEETASQQLLRDQYKEEQQNIHHLRQYHNNNNNDQILEMLGYELRFIGDRLFNFKQQIHGTKKKYLCDCRRLEDRLVTIEQLQHSSQQQGYQDNELINRICKIDQLKNRVDGINSSVGNHVSELLDKLSLVDHAYQESKQIFKHIKPDDHR